MNQFWYRLKILQIYKISTNSSKSLKNHLKTLPRETTITLNLLSHFGQSIKITLQILDKYRCICTVITLWFSINDLKVYWWEKKVLTLLPSYLNRIKGVKGRRKKDSKRKNDKFLKEIYWKEAKEQASLFNKHFAKEIGHFGVAHESS